MAADDPKATSKPSALEQILGKSLHTENGRPFVERIDPDGEGMTVAERRASTEKSTPPYPAGHREDWVNLTSKLDKVGRSV